MTELFLKLVNMSIAATWLVLTVVMLRLVLKKAPKWVNVLLWGIVAVRLLCPFTLESALSLIPSTETIPEKVLTGPSFEVHTGIDPIDGRVNDYLGDRYFEGVTVPANNGGNIMTVLTILWIVGMAAMLVYTAVSYRRLRSRVSTAVRLRDNIFRSEQILSPFVLGVCKPRIYLPSSTTEQDAAHVIAHEQAHIRRRDHWWKPLSFLLLTLHWFNPIMWLAYILLCRDIELACDEKVIKELGTEQRADYSQALLSCSVSRGSIAACPLAFGEVGVKERVRSVLSYKKPAFWIILIALVVCLTVSICFLTDPIPEDTPYAVTHTLRTSHVEWVDVTIWQEKTIDIMLTDEQTEELIDTLNDLDADDFLQDIRIEGDMSVMIRCAQQDILLHYDGEFVEFIFDSTTAEPIGDLDWGVRDARLNAFLADIRAVAEDIDTTSVLTRTDVIRLSKKQGELAWEDFAGYPGTAVGSGFYINRYEIDSEYYLLVWANAEPKGQVMQTRLSCVSTGESADIRDADVGAFFSEQERLRDALSVHVQQATMLQVGLRASPAYTWEYSDASTVICQEPGERPIVLSCAGTVEYGGYKIYLPDGTVYDDGTREVYDSLGYRVMLGEQLTLLTPYEAGTYIYELTLYWPEYDKTMTYGLRVVINGAEQQHLEPTVNGIPNEDPEYWSFTSLASIEGFTVKEIKALLVNAPLEKIQWSWGEPNQTLLEENAYVYLIPDSDARIILYCDAEGIVENVTVAYTNGLPIRS